MELSTAQIIPILIYTENLHLHIPNDIIYKNKKSEEEIMSEISMISKKVNVLKLVVILMEVIMIYYLFHPIGKKV